MLFGISLVYGFAGATDFQSLAGVLQGELAAGALIGLVFTMAGLAFKISAVPFHMWTPDVYEGSPTPVAAFFASAPKVAAMGLLVRTLMEAFGNTPESWRGIVGTMAVLSMFLGAIAAIGQTDIKRLLAYSSINNVGFALIGLAVGTAAGVSSVLFYMAVYAVMTLAAFLAVLELRDLDGRPVEQIPMLAGLARQRPGLAAALAIVMFSLAGVPPLMGFFPKLAVFNAAVGEGMYGLAVLGVLASVVGAYYYLRIVKLMYFDEPLGAVAPRLSAVNGALLALGAVALSPIGWLALGPLAAAAQTAAGALFLP
jgi:NADH-quinone oxidoreductase subunit N